MKEDIILRLGGNIALNNGNKSDFSTEKELGLKFEAHFASAFKEQSATKSHVSGNNFPQYDSEVGEVCPLEDTRREHLKGGRSIIIAGQAPTDEEVRAFAELQGIDPKGLANIVDNKMNIESDTVGENKYPHVDDNQQKLVPQEKLLDTSALVNRLALPDEGVSIQNHSKYPRDIESHNPERSLQNEGVKSDGKVGGELGQSEYAIPRTEHPPIMAKLNSLNETDSKPLRVDINQSSPSIQRSPKGRDRVEISAANIMTGKKNKNLGEPVKLALQTKNPNELGPVRSGLKVGEGTTPSDIRKVIDSSADQFQPQFKKTEMRRHLQRMIETKAQLATGKRENTRLAPIDLTDVVKTLPEEILSPTVKKSGAYHPELVTDPTTNLRVAVKESTQSGDSNVTRTGNSIDSDRDGGLSDGIRRSLELEPITRKMSEILGQRLLAQIAKGAWRVEMELYPRSLGRVEVHLEMINGQLEAHFHTNHTLTKEMLAEGIPRLRDSLEEHGMESAYVSVELGNRKETDKNQTGEDQSSNLSSIIDSNEELQRSEKTDPINFDGRFDFFV